MKLYIFHADIICTYVEHFSEDYDKCTVIDIHRKDA